jgi:lipoprotein-releasing system permease protein
MTRAVEIPGMITFTDPFSEESYTFQVHIHGIEPEGKAAVGPLSDYLDSYNPIIEDGKVIRPPLRDKNEPLGWTLTPDAAEYRRQKKEFQAFRLQQSGIQIGGHTAADPPATQPEDSTGSGAQAPETDTADSTVDVAADSSESPALQDNPFDMDAPVEQPSKVQTEPYPAKIYLAEGIVSFQAPDPDNPEKFQKVMMVNPGDDVLLGTITASNPPDTVTFRATVVDTFRSGMNDLDTSIVLMNIDELQRVRGMLVTNADGSIKSDAITSIHIRLKDYDNAPEVVRLLKSTFPGSWVSVRTWEEKQGLLLEAVEVETAILNVLLFLIIAVAGFGILAIFFMIVVEKTRDIGILKSLGASSSGVMSIFLSYGLALGMVGSLAGVAIGLLFVAYINEIEDVLSWVTGRKVFDEKIYYFHEIPTHVSAMMVFLVALGAIMIAVLASVLPARRASRLHPVKALRYE